MQNSKNININLPTEMIAMLHSAVETGDYTSSDQIICEALQEWHQKHILQNFDIEKLRQFVQEGIDSGPGVDAEEVFSRLEKKYSDMEK